MADAPGAPVDAGKAAINPPSNLPLKSEDQFRVINQRLDALANEMGRISKPAAFDLANLLQIGIVTLTLIGAFFGLSSMNERLADLKADISAAERRVSDGLASAETRLSTKLEKLNDQLTKIDERTSRLEGSKSGK